MTTSDVKANRLTLNKRCEFAYDGKHCWAPMLNCPASGLLEAMNAIAADSVQVSFHTLTAETAEQDKKTYTRRLMKLFPYYTFSGWKQMEINGHVQSRHFIGTLLRDGAFNV